ncbi:hypothetical protein HO978_09710 [Streptococcus suis]|nr:hypothetical protein [Streptococcus suis]
MALYQRLEHFCVIQTVKLPGYELKQRLIQALARKGYDFDRIQAVLRDYL